LKGRGGLGHGEGSGSLFECGYSIVGRRVGQGKR
jgi:hypothetical protein